MIYNCMVLSLIVFKTEDEPMNVDTLNRRVKIWQKRDKITQTKEKMGFCCLHDDNNEVESSILFHLSSACN